MNKSTNKVSTIDEYIDMFPGEIQTRLEKIRSLIKKTIPSATETISYDMPAFKVEGKTIVYCAAFKNHIGFYPFPSGIAAFKKESVGFKTSTGTIQFPHDKPIPYNLVEKMVKYRAQENSASYKK